MVNISQRLFHLSELVSKDVVLADIGTDHGYLPIFLIETGKILHAYAMDIRKGPLQRARKHCEAYGLGDYITIRLSDGLLALRPGEADSIVIAGMGGGVMIHILTEGKDRADAAKELILQPQSEIKKVRAYLYSKGYAIDREDLVFEDGKYYPMMHVLPNGGETEQFSSERERQMIFRYGRYLLDGRDERLRQYLLAVQKQYQSILASLLRQEPKESLLKRKGEVLAELSFVEEALLYWGGKEH